MATADRMAYIVIGKVSAHQKKGIWRAIAKEVRTLGGRKRWEDLRRWSKKTAEAQLGMASQRGRGARRTMTPLDSGGGISGVGWALRASQQPQGGEYSLIQLTLRALRGVWVGNVGHGFS
ncbi:hypothetical protein NDU88_003309 [Pleurodeles waltl]|uniref:Uncharacterized protein n=1 Tax=Pleurodeles waltl TaxID=8319 RepID=A0AAV7UY46_PLEWA|nr:hypothetical protein NDU88_003309 [Pleurodeles waltl]